MNYIKGFEEYTNTDKNKPICENELKFEEESIVYKTYYPKVNEDDYAYVRDNRKLLWDFFDEGYKYANLKEFRSCVNERSLWKNTSCLKTAVFNGKMVAASIYTSYQGGMKCVGITATTDPKYRNIGKRAVVHIIKEDISLVGNFYWTECSDAIEHLYEKHGGVKIPNDYLYLFNNEKKEKLDDGYHFIVKIKYSDGETEDCRKVIFGFNSQETFDVIKQENDERIMECINRITHKPIKESVYVRNLSKEDYYTEVVYVFYDDRVNGNKDYSETTMNLLKEAVEYLKIFVKTNKKVDMGKYLDAIENGEDLMATATIMDIHSNILI